MKFDQAIASQSLDELLAIAKGITKARGWIWTEGVAVLLNACYENPTLAPSLGSTKDDVSAVVQRWLQRYWRGYENRISVRLSNLPQTTPDSVIDTIIQTRLPHLSTDDLTKIKYAHRLSMSAENILGLFLEEYLHEQLLPHGWFCAWGETIRGVDFCHRDGRLLQIKNRSNSENSSSSKIRKGTAILKWHRVDARTGRYLWTQLNEQYSSGIFSESGFREFIVEKLKANPGALAVEMENTWQNK